jgi:hypothetical protein
MERFEGGGEAGKMAGGGAGHRTGEGSRRWEEELTSGARLAAVERGERWSGPRELLGRELRKRSAACCWPSGLGKELGHDERKKEKASGQVALGPE